LLYTTVELTPFGCAISYMEKAVAEHFGEKNGVRGAVLLTGRYVISGGPVREESGCEF
jgi:hypothetical protein